MKMNKRVKLGESIQELIKGNKPNKAIIKSTGQNEATAADGGNLVQNNLIATILSPDFMAGSIYEKCTIFNVGDDNAGVKIPISNEPTRNAAGILGGVLAYVVGEGVAKTPSDAAFSILDLGFNKIAVVITLTDEIKSDSELLGQFVQKAASDAIKWIVDTNIVYGGGALNAIANHPATGFSDVAGVITAAELKDIYDLYYQNKNGCWVVSQDMWIDITNLWDTATQTPQIPLTWDMDGTPILWGYPVIVSDVMRDTSLVLGDFSQYVIAQKEMTQAVNESLKFVEDESYLRFVLRINGSSMWAGPMTLTDGSVVHPFVMKTDDEQSTSSEGFSSSSSSIDSSSTSSTSPGSTSSTSSSSSSSSIDSSSSESTDESNSSGSSDSSSTNSSQSSSSSSSSFDSSSSESGGDCNASYVASTFATADINGTYAIDGQYNGKAKYYNGTYWLFFADSNPDYWAISGDAGDPQNQWVTSKDTAGDCPDGTYVGEAGTLV